MTNWKGFAGFVLFLAAALVTAWPAADASAQAAKEVVIGYTGPLSGVAAEYGQDVGHGIEMAVS
ncbi:MAG TPA: hypothetical protein VEH09_08110, partial [Thermodesulfobacteriota bacterium]|nr:hypothetical protein [Thermodesulfobacteriota bacterium]